MRFLVPVLVLMLCACEGGYPHPWARELDGSLPDAGYPAPGLGRCSEPDGVVVPLEEPCAPGWIVACTVGPDARVERNEAGACTAVGLTVGAVCRGGLPAPSTLDGTCGHEPGLEWRCAPLLDGCPAPR